ncbi:unnamed protein product [Caenorhabditis auriculariae]|uniref:Myosin motor domain-containing protein n=1 Tax=Caenorhabditis auriculariae TaxID=2777116 RepID=A0A8S1GQV8_9PELO|nr:unnamed protein product [Caenorhabditis auriculariae]
MWHSTTLPRLRPSDPPPPPPQNRAVTLHRKNRNVDVDKLRCDIDILSQQLMMVKARLESTLALQEEVEEDDISKENSNKNSVQQLLRVDSTDSRLSTVLFSPTSPNSMRHTPTPKPTLINIPIGNDKLRKPLSMSTSHLAHLKSPLQEAVEKRMSLCLPSSSCVMPRVKRRETFTRADDLLQKSKSTLRITKVKRAGESRQQIFDHWTDLSGYATSTSAKTFENFSRNSTPSSYTMSSVALLSMCSHEEFLEAIRERFKQGQCWFSRGGQLYFVNPFNDVSATRHLSYSVIPTVTSSLIETKQSALLLRGISGSGKSQLAEMVCLDVVDRMDTQGSISAILYAALIALRPFLSTNNSQNNQASKAVLASCILLNNLNFREENNMVDIENLPDLEDASALLGVSALAMYRAIVTSSIDGFGRHSVMDCQTIRDNFVSAIYARTVHYVQQEINNLLDSFPDNGSLITDSGVSVGNSSTDSHTIHVVDVPGYVRSNNNSLAELLVNSVNDILQATNPDSVDLFDIRSCTFAFAVKLFCNDVERQIIDRNYESRAIDWPIKGVSVIQNVLQSIKKLQFVISDATTQQIICLKSNDHLEYARLQDFTLTGQLELYRLVIANSSRSSLRLGSTRDPSSIPLIPNPRSYEIRDGRKHRFPQRRNVVIDFQDPTSGVSLRAGEIVKTLGFSGECYLVETGRKARATVPVSFTEKSIPPAGTFHN